MNRAPDCDTCQAWDEHANLPGLGYCRRHAPGAQHVSADDGGIILTIWPETDGKGDGCLDHVGMPVESGPPGSVAILTSLSSVPVGWLDLDATDPGLMRVADAQPSGTERKENHDVRDWNPGLGGIERPES